MARLMSDTEKHQRAASAEHLRAVLAQKLDEREAAYRSRLNPEARRERAAVISAELAALEHAIRVLGEE